MHASSILTLQNKDTFNSLCYKYKSVTKLMFWEEISGEPRLSLRCWACSTLSLFNARVPQFLKMCCVCDSYLKINYSHPFWHRMSCYLYEWYFNEQWQLIIKNQQHHNLAVLWTTNRVQHSQKCLYQLIVNLKSYQINGHRYQRKWPLQSLYCWFY